MVEIYGVAIAPIRGGKVDSVRSKRGLKGEPFFGIFKMFQVSRPDRNIYG